MLACCPWLRLRTPRGLGRLLRRLGISYQRGRDYVHSPDPDYAAKLAVVADLLARAQAPGSREVVLYLDELTIKRQPTLAAAWAERGGERAAQPRAVRSHTSNTITRILGALNPVTGELHSLRAAKISVARLVSFCSQLAAAYPTADRLWLVLDNWPVHFHADVLGALEPQCTAFPGTVPAHWPSAPSETTRRRWAAHPLPIQLVPLPTYASWCNPIEKVWRKLRQDLGHLHPWATDLARLRAELDAWLATYRAGSPELLRYVGLKPAD